MTRKAIKVAANLLHIHRHVGHSLGSVNEYRHIVAVGDIGDLLDRIDGSEGVRDMVAGH